MPLVDRLDDVRLHRPEQRFALTGRGDLRQRRAPRAAADDPELHALTPAPRTLSACSSSGQRARAGTSRASVMPAAKRSAPAQAIIAALSVHSQAGGTLNLRPLELASAASACRTARFAATPPATTKAGASVLASASRVRSTRQSTIACWRLAAMSSGRKLADATAHCTALLSPAKEKCGSPDPTNGRGSGTAVAFPCTASASIAGPPG